MNDTTLILASASPRRRELLALTGLPFTVDAPDVDESCTLPPREAVMELSRRKAQAAAALHPGCIILAADTLVSVDETALGKPRDEADAFRMLRALSGRWHQVYTGVTVMGNLGSVRISETCSEKSEVHVAPMDYSEIWEYIETGDPMDKAGSYGIQGFFSRYIDHIDGDYFNIVGLPAHRVYQELKKILG